MRRLLAIPAAALVALAALAQQPAPKPDEVERLVEQLGSPDFAEREAATLRLEHLGTAVIDQLRLATRSENPEVARRAQDVLRKAERRLSSEKTLAPTLVELEAKEQPLDAVLAELSKQAGCEVVLSGARPADLADRKATVSTGGKVPFWAAVLKVCDAADLQIASVAGFLGPGSVTTPAPRDRGKSGVRVPKDPNKAVVLEARGTNPRRPAAVAGAVLVEAVPFPKWADPTGPSVLLQVWPEPRLQWQGIGVAKVTAALGPDGGRLSPEADVAIGPKVERTNAEGVVIIRNPDGSVRVVRDAGGLQGLQTPGAFTPNPRQVVVRFKPGEKPAAVAKELAVSVFATVRSGTEAVCRVGGLAPNKPARAAGPGGTEVSITYAGEGGTLAASVQVVFDPREVQPAGVGDELPGTVAGGPGVGNSTVHGLRVTDADGKPYTLGLATGLTRRDPSGKRTALILSLQLHAGKRELGPPDAATLWGTYAKTVEVPVILKDVPLAGAK